MVNLTEAGTNKEPSPQTGDVQDADPEFNQYEIIFVLTLCSIFSEKQLL